jgi:hypothetical protein
VIQGGPPENPIGHTSGAPVGGSTGSASPPSKGRLGGRPSSGGNPHRTWRMSGAGNGGPGSDGGRMGRHGAGSGSAFRETGRGCTPAGKRGGISEGCLPLPAGTLRRNRAPLLHVAPSRPIPEWTAASGGAEKDGGKVPDPFGPRSRDAWGWQPQAFLAVRTVMQSSAMCTRSSPYALRCRASTVCRRHSPYTL